MKKSLLLALLCSTLFYCSCTKSNENRCQTLTVYADSTETSNLKTYLTTKGINAVADPRGFFYVLNNSGDTTLPPTICSTIRTSYTGRLLNGIQFDASNFATFPLSSLVLGWQEG